LLRIILIFILMSHHITTFPPLTRRRALSLALGAAVLASRPAVAQTAPLEVVATTGMIADAARVVGGDRVAVRALMGPGIDPHSYRQTRSDIVLWHGLYLEAQMEEFLLKLAARSPVVPVGEAVPDAARIAHEDYEGRYDPHVWMVPDLWASVVDRIAETLSAERPEDAELFASNAARYKEDLARLGRYATGVLASVAAPARVLVTAHDAFGYFGRAYGYQVEGIQGLSTESEAGLARIRDLVDLLVSRQIRAVFVESTVSDRNIRALIEGAAAQGHEVIVGGELFSDAMGAPGTYEGSYLGMIDHNVTTIAGALGGTAPARGMDDRLAVGG